MAQRCDKVHLCVIFALQGENDTPKMESTMLPQAKTDLCVNPEQFN
jgi:hypothetical protein